LIRGEIKRVYGEDPTENVKDGIFFSNHVTVPLGRPKRASINRQRARRKKRGGTAARGPGIGEWGVGEK